MRKIKMRTFSGTTDAGVTKREMEHRKIARKAASEGMVLLKNDKHLLPLPAGSKVALYGAGATKTIKGGTGSGDVNQRETISIYQGMKEKGFIITNESWILEYDKAYEEARCSWRDMILEKARGKEDSCTDFFRIYSSTSFSMPTGKPIEETPSDDGIAFYIHSRVAGEGADRHAKDGDYYFTEEEKKLLSDICHFYEKVIVVMNTGGLADLSFLEEHENICGLIQMVQAGMEGGSAFADLVSGEVTFSGKMTDSWAYQYEDYPNAEKFSHNNGNVEQETYEEGIYVGYRYFDTFEVPVRFCFGYGMSYTDFSIEVTGIRLSKERKPEILVKAKVTNTGTQYSGKEVIQMYVSPPLGEVEKEYRRLAAFGKTKELKPGESEEIILCVPIYQIASFDEKKCGWILEKGEYGIWIGNNLCDSKLVAAIRLEQDKILVKTGHICPIQQKFEEVHPDYETQNKKYQAWSNQIQKEKLPLLTLSLEDTPTEKIKYQSNTKLVKKEARDFVDTLTEEQLINLSSGDPGKAQGGNLGAAGISVPGSAGETHSCGMKQNLASIVLADGPAGLRLMQYYYVQDGKIVNMPFQFSLEGGIFCLEASNMSGERYYQYTTAIPVGTLLAQTFDTKLIEEVGEMIGREMQEFGVTLWLAPGMNIHRNPLCGRNFEYYSEDPLLTGKIAAAMTLGVQKNPGCGTTIKHFACNNQEDNRMGSDSIVSERALREIYLKGFEIAVKEANPMSMMTSYNLVNGIHAANSGDLCTKAARCEWGFSGVIMTDWTTTEVDETCTAAGCIRAGNDLIMPGSNKDHENLREELMAGTLSLEELKSCISRLVHSIWQSNQYEKQDENRAQKQ